MKKFFTNVLLLFFVASFSQQEVAKKIKELEKNQTFFIPFSVLNVVQNTSGYSLDKVVLNASIAAIKTNVVNDIVANNYQNIELTIPFKNKKITLDLYQVNLVAEGFHVDTDKLKNIKYQKGVYYRGIVKGDYTSVVSFNFFKNELNGVISSPELSNVVIGKLDKKNNTTDYIIYADTNLKIVNSFECSFKDDESKRATTNPSNTKSASSNRCVSIYFETDYNLFQSNNNNTTDTTNWITSVFNNIQTLYANDGISIAIKSLFIWTTLDPYEGVGTTSTDYLYKFNEVRPIFDGDVGQLVGVDAGGLGGVAVGINGLCSQYNFSYSDVNFSYNSIPTYSWTIEVITHELGHLLGSPHTHACVWNGNNTAIDNCAGVAIGTAAEGYSCMDSPPIIPSSTEKGTIMSYCHLISGIGINLSNGFGTQPATTIINAVNSGTCLSTNCIDTCINTVASISIDSVSSTTATFSWMDIGSAFSSWQVAIYPFGGSATSWLSVSTPSFTTTGLNPDTYYIFEVRPNCTFGLISGSRKLMFVSAADFCNGLVFTDSGGVNNNYSDQETVIRTIIPNAANNSIVLTFSEFSFEQDYDFLSVFDGNTTAATLLGKYTGTTIPGPFTSTATDGSLTVAYTSDQFLNFSGFVANISCTPNLSVNNYNDYLDFSYYPNPTKGKVSIVSKTNINKVLVYSVSGQLLFENEIHSLNANVDISSFAVGTYFFKLKFDGDKEAHFKVMRE
jgi:hypothetical protein